MISSIEVEHFLAFLRQAEQQREIARTELSEAEQQTQDILHAVEFANYNARLTARLVQTLREIRQRRRKAKETIEETDFVVAWIEENKPAIKALERLLDDLRKVERRRSGRMYNPRTDIMKGLEKIPSE